MAENDSEKTEHLSQKKLEQSRKKGELPRSQELGTFIVFGIFLIYFSLTQLAWLEGLGEMMANLLRFDRYMGIGRDDIGLFLLTPALQAIAVVAPLFAIVLLISPLVSLCQTQFNIATEKLAPNWGKLDPVAGLKRMVSLRQVIEGAKACVKIMLFTWLAWGAIQMRLPRIMVMATLDLREQLSLLLDLGLAIGLRVVLLMAVLAVADLGYQWWEFIKKLRMTQQEMKDESKEREGNPLIRQRQRSLQMEAARRRMMSEVAKASVVVTNPTHYAVALTYDVTRAPAPLVVARGTRLMALRIRRMALEAGVPVIENKPLARALYRHAKVGRAIPNQFYRAVAELLAFVHLLKRQGRKTSGVLRQPNPTRPPVQV